MAKPTSLPRWGETVGGVVGGNEVEPNEGKKDTGYDAPVGGVGDVPTSGGLNWWMRLVYLWAKWLNDAASAATASVLVVRDAAGRARFADPSDVADADTMGARDTAIGVHDAVTNPHSSTSAATASRLVLRDAAGRAQVADPSAAADIDTKGARDTAVNAGPSVVGTATAGSNWSITGGSTAGKRYANKLVSLECFVSVTNTPPGTSILTLSDSLQPASNVEAHVLARLQRGASWFVVGVLVNGSSSALQVDDSFTYQTGDVLAVSLMYRGA